MFWLESSVFIAMPLFSSKKHIYWDQVSLFKRPLSRVWHFGFKNFANFRRVSASEILASEKRLGFTTHCLEQKTYLLGSNVPIQTTSVRSSCSVSWTKGKTKHNVNIECDQVDYMALPKSIVDLVLKLFVICSCDGFAWSEVCEWVCVVWERP